jgi:hypothetical protein
MLGPLVSWRSSCSNSQYWIKTEEARKSLLLSCCKALLGISDLGGVWMRGGGVSQGIA